MWTDNSLTTERKTPYNSSYPKGGVSYSIDNFVGNQALVFQIKFCGKSPPLRVAAKRYNSLPGHSVRRKILH